MTGGRSSRGGRRLAAPIIGLQDRILVGQHPVLIEKELRAPLFCSSSACVVPVLRQPQTIVLPHFLFFMFRAWPSVG